MNQELKEKVADAIGDAFDIDWTNEQLAEAAMNVIADDLDAQAGKATIRTADILQRIAKQLREDK